MAKKTVEAPPEPEVLAGGKGRATPSRREREAANRRPIVVADRKAARRTSKTREAETRERARIGLANGEERYLPVRDKGPQRKFARDWIDSQWTIGEFLIPVFVVFFVATLLLPVGDVAVLPAVRLPGARRSSTAWSARAVIRRRIAQKLGDASRSSAA